MTLIPGAGVYIHIPFCRRRCLYCDFVSNAIPGAIPDAFIQALEREILSFSGPAEAVSVFLGGGTPSLLTPSQLGRILVAVRLRFKITTPGRAEPEVTMEANPDDVTEDLLSAARDAGVTRLSLGAQSFDDTALRYLGRRHDAASAVKACERTGRCFSDWSMDLIFGARPTASWESTLARCVSLAPPHVSAYGLTYEQGTPFGERVDEALDEDESLELYRRTDAILGASGRRRYEISNHASPGYECVHNLVYWRNGVYVGFGPGAYSYLDGVRSRNADDLDAYLQAPGAKEETIPINPGEERVETLIQHFRLTEGIPFAAYHDRFGEDLDSGFGLALKRLVARGLLERTEEGYRPTQAGFELNNEIGLVLVGEEPDQ